MDWVTFFQRHKHEMASNTKKSRERGRPLKKTHTHHRAVQQINKQQKSKNDKRQIFKSGEYRRGNMFTTGQKGN